jgi:YegS/Rv2252/BmrU family lipid kinase
MRDAGRVPTTSLAPDRPGQLHIEPPSFSSGCCGGDPDAPPYCSGFSRVEGKLEPVPVRNVFVVLNPHGGNGRGARAWAVVRSVFEENGVKFELLETERPRHATEALQRKNLDGFDAVVVVGGDGTISESLRGMMLREDKRVIPFGLVPGGTGNSVVVTMEATDPRRAALNIVRGFVRRIDVGKVVTDEGTFYMLNIVGFGLASESNVTAENLRCCGRCRYDVAGLYNICLCKRRSTRLRIDGEDIERDVAFAMVQNNQHSGVEMRFAPYAKLDDGLFDLILFPHASVCRLLSAFDALKKGGRHIYFPECEYRRFRSLQVVSEHKSVVNIDGECNAFTPLSLDILPGALPVFFDPELAK